MNNVFNLNEGEILILKETNYDDFIKNGNKIVINKPNINPVYKNLTNKEIPIKLVEGSYDSKKLTDNKIYIEIYLIPIVIIMSISLLETHKA